MLLYERYYMRDMLLYERYYYVFDLNISVSQLYIFIIILIFIGNTQLFIK